MNIFDQLFPPASLGAPLPQYTLPVLPELYSLKRWHREHKWCWCPQCAMVNRYGARVRVDMAFKHCGNCGTSLFTAFDSPWVWPASLPDDQAPPWFMRLVKGPRGTGWYRRQSIQILFPT